ncbi:MAG: hypothetical protein HQM15_03695 [Deltaproteobacteria bacterium]|nr:hypothetical protein [Deltaproteobacteria bacterium]
MLRYQVHLLGGNSSSHPVSPTPPLVVPAENTPHLLSILGEEASYLMHEIRNRGSELRTSSFWTHALTDLTHTVRTEVLTSEMAKEVGKMFVLGMVAGAVGSFASRQVLTSFGVQQVERLALGQLFNASSRIGVRALAGTVGMLANASVFSLLTGALSSANPGASLVHVTGSATDFSLMHAGNWALHPLMQALPLYLRVPLDVLCGGLLFSGASALRTDLFNTAHLSREEVAAHLTGTQLFRNMGFHAGNRAVGGFAEAGVQRVSRFMSEVRGSARSYSPLLASLVLLAGCDENGEAPVRWPSVSNLDDDARAIIGGVLAFSALVVVVIAGPKLLERMAEHREEALIEQMENRPESVSVRTIERLLKSDSLSRNTIPGLVSIALRIDSDISDELRTRIISRIAASLGPHSCARLLECSRLTEAQVRLFQHRADVIDILLSPVPLEGDHVRELFRRSLEQQEQEKGSSLYLINLLQASSRLEEEQRATILDRIAIEAGELEQSYERSRSAIAEEVRNSLTERYREYLDQRERDRMEYGSPSWEDGPWLSPKLVLLEYLDERFTRTLESEMDESVLNSFRDFLSAYRQWEDFVDDANTMIQNLGSKIGSDELRALRGLIPEEIRREESFNDQPYG